MNEIERLKWQEMSRWREREKKEEKGASVILLYWSELKINPRHSPRAFPLGLLAPKLLGAVLFLAILL